MANYDFYNNYNHIFMIVLFFIGIILTTVSWDIDSKLQETECKSQSLKTSNKLVLTIGITLIVSSISFFTCTSYTDAKFEERSLSVYIISMTILGIVLIALGSIISSESNESCANKGNPSNIWGIGLFIVLLSLGYFYLKFKNIKKL
jgi:hypothetical protein